jgi:hypothetical protein
MDPNDDRAQILQAVDSLEQYVRELAGVTASYERTSYSGGLSTLSVTPLNDKARPLNVVGQQWLQVEAGDHGGCWELDYTDEGIERARELIEAVIAGRVVELMSLARSEVRATLASGEQVRETGYGTGLGWLPLLGWRNRARVVAYEPYRAPIMS